MRPLISAVAAAALFSGTAFAQPCMRPAEKAAFDVAGLKSELMVVAIACQLRDKYNGFVGRYRSALVAQERALNGYFSRTSGHRAQQEHDVYITNLANSQSQDGIREGTLFCTQHLSMFDEVMALKSDHELAGYAQTKGLTQPIALIECPVAPVRTPRAKKVRTADTK
ncbi:MAG: hypothetical protein J0I21_17995 [Alphaproteobacteria bacterium]|nr:hypothetical protein [Alphaproteobacteria bacterium]